MSENKGQPKPGKFLTDAGGITLREMFTHHRDRLKAAMWPMAVDGSRESSKPLPAGADTDAFVDRLAPRLLHPPFRPPPPPVTEDDRRYRDKALAFALDRLEVAIDLDFCRAALSS